MISDTIVVGDQTLYKGGTWPKPVIPYEEGEEEFWDTACRGYGPIPPKENIDE